LLFHKADWVPERILGIEATFAPRLCFDFRVDSRAGQVSGSFEHELQIIHGKVNVVGIGAGVKSVTIRSWIKAGKDDSFAVEIVAARTDAFARVREKMTVKRRCRVNV